MNLLLTAFALLGLIISPALAAGQGEKPVSLYLFWSKGCPHCKAEKKFLTNLEGKHPGLKVQEFEVTASKENLELLYKVADRLQVRVSGVPFTVVGEAHFSGWHEPTSGPALEAAIVKARSEGAPDVVAGLVPAKPPVPVPPGAGPRPEKITVPLLGELEVKSLSLGLFTVVIGALDGFNPCAMWVLILLLGLLLGMENNLKRWVLGGSFIAASALVYFMIMVAWLNLFLFLGFLFWVRLAIAVVALGAGFYNLKEYFTDRAGVCKVTAGEGRQRLFARVKGIIEKRGFWLALGGIVLLALAVNVVELICSAGFPVVYLQVLSLTPMPRWQYYLYILLYIFIFMLDDLIVFAVALVTFQVTGMSARYKRFSNLIGGVLMLLLGLLLIFKPEALMFG